MKKTVITILLLVAFMGGFLIFYNLKTVSSPIQNDSETLNTPQKWESKIDDQASVTVTVTPSDLGVESEEWKFDIVMSTHSVELDQDLIKNSLLIDDNGNEFKPTRWDGPTGGHHREGILVFNPISPLPQSIELKITGIGEVVRSFAWQLNK